MKIRGITVNDYIVARDKFIQLLEKNKLTGNSKQEASIITLQNQKDFLMEDDLIEGLKMCPSQYDLVETFPLIGHAILVKRFDGSMINPYLITVVGMARHHKVVDTVSIQQNGNELQLSAGNQDKEIVNAVIPLFEEEDKDLKPFLTSQLFSIVMTFNTMQNADTCFDNAYFALIANTYIYLILQEENEWKQNMLKLIVSTISIIYSQGKNFKLFCDNLLEKPRIAVVTEHPDLPTKCEDLSKALVFFHFLVSTGTLKEEAKKEEILDAIMAETIGRNYPKESEVKLIQFFSLINKETLKNIDFSPYIEMVLKDFPDILTFYTLDEIKHEVSKRVMKLDIKLNIEFDLDINLDNMWFMQKQE